MYVGFGYVVVYGVGWMDVLCGFLFGYVLVGCDCF